MMMTRGDLFAGITLLVVGLSVVVDAKPQAIYVGFDHLVVIQQQGKNISAFDLRRDLARSSTCDFLAHPALLQGAHLSDWVTESAESILYTSMGYENFLMEDKATGAFVGRRCRDFRPQLDLLPCEAYVTGSSAKLAHPYRTIFIGNNRAMILNTETGQYDIQPFDADVHTGGDPFLFGTGPLLSGVFPSLQDLNQGQFAYVQLDNHGGDLLVHHLPEQAKMTAYKFHGSARRIEEWELAKVTSRSSPQGFAMIGVGENDLLFFDDDLNFLRWSVIANGSGIVFESREHGNVWKGSTCNYDNATACVQQFGCAWCPSSYTCHTYDRINAKFCDAHGCSVAPILDSVKANQPVIVPDCISNPDPESMHADIFDSIDAGYEQLPGHIRLDTEYRKDEGDHSHVEAAPIHPAIDNELGDEPIIVDSEFNGQVIHENNRVASGNVYTPPAPSKSAPCMDNQYDNTKAVDRLQNTRSTNLMNHPQTSTDELPLIHTTSPSGESLSAEESVDCTRHHPANATGTIQKHDFELQHKTESFVPASGQPQAPATEFVPAITSSRHEEDLMNSDHTEYSDLKARWVDPAEPKDETRGPLREHTVADGFRPKEPAKRSRAPSPALLPSTPSQPALRIDGKESFMDQGLDAGSASTIGADCTETGGDDARAAPVQVAAMMNSVKASFPATLEEQIHLNNDEKISQQNAHEDTISLAGPDGQLHEHLPEVEDETQPQADTQESSATARVG